MKSNSKAPQPRPFTDESFIYWTQFIVGLVIALWGAYFLGPWETQQYTVAPSNTYSPEFFVGPLISFLQVASGVGVMVGALIRSKKVSNISLSATVLAYSLVVTFRIISTGFLPFYWLFQLGLALIAMLLMLRSGLSDNGLD